MSVHHWYFFWTTDDTDLTDFTDIIINGKISSSDHRFNWLNRFSFAPHSYYTDCKWIALRLNCKPLFRPRMALIADLAPHEHCHYTDCEMISQITIRRIRSLLFMVFVSCIIRSWIIECPVGQKSYKSIQICQIFECFS